MLTLTRIITALFDALLSPFGAHRLAALIVLSVATGAVLTLLYRAWSNQAVLGRARDRFSARLIEMRIYPDSIADIMRAWGGALAAQGAYLRSALLPIAGVLLVGIPLFVQAQQRFAVGPLTVGSTTIITARLSGDHDMHEMPHALSVSDGVLVDGPPLHAPAARETAWRVRVTAPGRHVISLEGGTPYAFVLQATPDTRAIGRMRAAHGTGDAISHAGLPALPKGAVGAIRVHYPDASYRVLGRNVGWLTVFLVGTLVGAIVPARLLGVRF